MLQQEVSDASCPPYISVQAPMVARLELAVLSFLCADFFPFCDVVVPNAYVQLPNAYDQHPLAPRCRGCLVATGNARNLKVIC